jgi:DNA-binding XRE family transcriptional regulator
MLPSVSPEKEYYREVGRLIRAARLRAELTQQDLADEVELSRTSITNIESGNQPVSLWLLNVIAATVGRDLVELLPVSAGSSTGLPEDVPPMTAALIRRLESSR